ncbi:branched-chain amino acid ABC transporter permease [Chloroflexota bacterium]
MDVRFIPISLLNGVATGMVLFILTSGLSVTMGLMGIINLSHGVLFMIGGYFAWTIAVQQGLNYGLALIVGGLAAGAIGLGIERGFLRKLYRQPNQQVLLTIGFLYIIANLSLMGWGNLTRVPFTPDITSGSIPMFDLTYPVYRIAIIGIGVAFLIGLWWALEKTKFGALVRAGMDDQETTMGLGINMGRVMSLTFFIGAALAGLAGVIGAQLLGVHPDMAWDILLLALIVLVVGGIGTIRGAFVGALTIGIIDAFGRALFPDFARFLMYTVMIIIVLVRPEGILPRRE